MARRLTIPPALMPSQRPRDARPASFLPSLQPAVGVGRPSVFYGPQRALHPGAPALRQYKA